MARTCLIIKMVTLWCLLGVWCGNEVFGSGFGVFTQGASALGQADAVVAHSDSPSALFFNPALITGLSGTRVEAGTTLIIPHREFRSDDGSVSHTRDTVFTPSTFYLTHSFGNGLSAGLAVFNPFGLGTDWGSGWQGRYLATKSELESYNINPALAWRVTPYLSIAAGLDVVVLDAKLQSTIPTPFGDVRQKFRGDGVGVGYNVGLLLDLGKNVSFGASYRSEVRIGVDGDVSFGLPAPALAGMFPATGGKTTITLPQQVFAGLAYRPTDRLVLEGGMRWEDWSSFKELHIRFDQPVAGFSSVVYPRNWRSTFAINAGGTYRINETFSIMAGYLYGWNPVPDSTFEPAIPDADTHLFCLGAEGRFDRVTVALGYGYQLQRDRTKSTNLYGPYANGSYHADLNLVGVSLGYRF